LSVQASDPYTVILRSKSAPLGLLSDPAKQSRAHLLSSESFADVFGGPGGRRRKRPRLALGVCDESSLALSASGPGSAGSLDAHTGADLRAAGFDARPETRQPLFDKGTSRRIWGELYKVRSTV
jgi:nuclear GTP-binding protein